MLILLENEKLNTVHKQMNIEIKICIVQIYFQMH